MNAKSEWKYRIYRGMVAAGRWVISAVVAFIILFPVYWIFISSITPPAELFKMPIDYLPDHPTLDSYRFLIDNVGLLSKIGSTIIIIGATLTIGTVICVMGGLRICQIPLPGCQHWLCFHHCNYADTGSNYGKTFV